MKTIRKVFCVLISLSLISLHMAPLQAAMVQNDQVINQLESQLSREQLLEVLDRDEAQQQLAAMGVAPDEIKQRVAQMTDAEVATLNTHLGEQPAGGSVLGVLLVLFIVFVITDMLGATDIFPFINKV